MNPKWFIGFFIVFLLCSGMSLIIEKQDMLSTGSSQVSTFERLMSITHVQSTDILNFGSNWLQASSNTISALITIIKADYSFCKALPSNPDGNMLGQFFQYFMFCLTFGFFISLALYITQIVRGG